MWLGVKGHGRMVKKCGWGSKHVARGWQMCIIEQINEKKCRKKKKTYLGPMGVKTGRNGQLGGQNAWLRVETRKWGLANGNNRANELKNT
jgi:hypothetical protein